jgi:8-oxo-dGTP pyrophosphatase MutT (NUDIX family)
MLHEQFINKLKLKLKEPLPGEEVQYVMAPLNRGKTDTAKLSKGDFKSSAVMLLICRDENDNLFIPLTQRYTYDGAHSGQISFPGGKSDEGDTDLTNTALRECREEIGITEDHIEILGNLTPLFIPVSNFLVQPVIGFCNTKNILFNKNEREVKSIIKLSLSELLNAKIVKTGLIEIRNSEKIKAPYFEIEGLIVWGATAMILNEFKAIINP